jgi:S1-C subfamily serine protease
MVFFLDAQARVYARYGGRDALNADNRQSLAGLRYTMQSVLAMHQSKAPAFAPRSPETVRLNRGGFGPKGGRLGMGRGCLHCHQVKEVLHANLKREGKWSRELIWRYPLPENLGFDLGVDRGNVVESVKDGSPAAAVGLRPGDVVRRLGGVPIHSFGDAQFALDLATKVTAIEIAWQRGGQDQTGKLALPRGWRKTDMSWRASLRNLMPSARLYGFDLTPAEKKALGLAPQQLAFRQQDFVPNQARVAGVRAGDIIVGLDGLRLEMTADRFQRYVQGHYLIGDRVTVNILREGKRMDLTMTLER